MWQSRDYFFGAEFHHMSSDPGGPAIAAVGGNFFHDLMVHLSLLKSDALICSFLIFAFFPPGSARDKCPGDTLQEQRRLAESLLQAGNNVQQAVMCFREALSKAEKLGNMQAKGELQGLLADALEAIGDSSGSEKLLRKMKSDFPYSPVPLFKLANQFRLKEKWEASVQLYQDALSLAPSFTNARVNLAMSFRGMRRFDDSIAAYREAIRGAPDRADIYVNFGVVLDAAGKARIRIFACSSFDACENTCYMYTPACYRHE